MKKLVFLLTFSALLTFFLTACKSIDLKPDTVEPMSTETITPTPEPTPKPILTETGNVGVTSAKVKLYFINNEYVRQWIPAHKLFDLSQIKHYHEYIHKEDSSIRIIFTTETTVRDFRFLSIALNDNYTKGGDEPFYSVRSILYSLDELTPEIPFVVTGANMGSSALAAEGFSFVDENGTTRYFAFHVSGYEGDDQPINVKDFYRH